MRFNTQRRLLSSGRKFAVIKAGGGICAYCNEEQATVAEHVIPYVYCQHNRDDNLVPSCRTCNAIAGSKLFEGFEAKRAYILEQRAKPRWRRRLSRSHLECRQCHEPFLPSTYGATAFLCPVCAQREGYPVWYVFHEQDCDGERDH